MTYTSFDVFDTCLTRAVGEPDEVFRIVGERAKGLQESGVTPGAFRRARILAERQCRSHAGEEATLAGIYGCLQFLLGLSSERAREIASLELDIEREVSLPVPRALEAVRRARLDGDRVSFISDMYLPASFVEELLERHGFLEPDDEVIVSSEVGITKRSGKLFRYCLDRAATSPGKWVHVGNDEDCDIRVPATMGVRTRPFLEANLNRYERLLQQSSEELSGLGTWWAGISRQIRLDPELAGERAIAAVSAGVAAPIIVSYVTWVLQQAERSGVKRLYFLARDGEVLLKTAQQLREKVSPGVECFYLHASRLAWRFPALLPIDHHTREWLLTSYEGGVTVALAAARLGMRTSALIEALATSGGTDSLSLSGHSAFGAKELDSLLSHPGSHRSVTEASEAAANALIKYLAESGCLQDDAWGIVDLGWHASLQYSLEKTLRTAGRPTPRAGFYFGLLDSRGRPTLPNVHSYLFDHRSFPAVYPHAGRCITAMECFCTASHATTVGYETDPSSGFVRPVLGEQVESVLSPWPIAEHQRCVQRYAQLAAAGGHLLATPELFKQVTLRLLDLFWDNPTREEVEGWGRILHSADGRASHALPIAFPYSPLDTARAMVRRSRTLHDDRLWHRGSLAISDGITRRVLSRLVRRG